MSPLLAQVDPAGAAEGLAKNPLAYIAAVLLLSLGYMFKLYAEERTRSAAALETARAAHLETVKADAKDQREILSQIVPLASKLTDGLEILERVTDKLTRE